MHTRADAPCLRYSRACVCLPPCRMLCDFLEGIHARCGRSKTRAKTSPESDYFFLTVKRGVARFRDSIRVLQPRFRKATEGACDPQIPPLLGGLSSTAIARVAYFSHARIAGHGATSKPPHTRKSGGLTPRRGLPLLRTPGGGVMAILSVQLRALLPPQSSTSSCSVQRAW